MLGSLNKLLLKLCDPRNSVSSSNTSPRSSRVVMPGRIAHPRTVRKRPHQQHAEQHANHSHNLQSAINRLPYELLAEIFATICHADSDQFLGDRNNHKKTTPLVLGSVCSHWRIVVWNNPRIWSHVSLCLSSPSGRYRAQVSLLKEWFERSGICPLTINIIFRDEDDWPNEIAHNLINVLVEQAYRWRSINFVLPEAWYPFLEPIKNKLTQLTTVSTQPLWADCGLSPSKRKRLTLFENAPLLNDLHLNGYYLTDVFLQWSQLTRITLQHVYLDECFYALPLVPNLTWCRIYTILINDVNRVVVDPDRPILLDKLKKFIVYRAAWGDLMRLLSSMSCVLLESFEISALFDDLIFPQLSTVLPRITTDKHHRSSLTRLVLSELDFTSRPAFLVERELKALLRDTPMLEDLEIEVSKKADRENAAFCSWWFIDLLGVQEPGVNLVEDHGKGKERGQFEVGSRNSDVSDDELLKGKGRSFGPSSRVPAKSTVSLRETLPLSPCYILPNLHNFTFSGPVIVHTCTATDDALTLTGTETTDTGSSTFPHPASFHVPVTVRKGQGMGFPLALLEVLSTRGGFGSQWLDPLHVIGEKGEYPAEEVETLDVSAPSNARKDYALKPDLKPERDDDSDDMPRIYFIDDSDEILALPADMLVSGAPSPSIATPVPVGDSTTSTVCPLPPRSTPLNLWNNLETFNLKATTYRCMSHGDPKKAKGACTNTSSLCRGGGMRGASNEVKAGLRRLTEEGGMKMKVVLGGEAWI